jgi:integrase
MPDGHIKSKTKRGFILKRDAQNYESDIKQSKIEISNTTLTLSDVFKEYMQNKKGSIVKITENEYNRYFEIYLSDLGQRKMLSLSPRDFLKVRQKIVNTDYSKSYKNKIIKLIKSVCKFGYNFYDFKDCGKQLTLVPLNSNDLKNYTIWSPNEFDHFISFIDDYVCKDFFIFLFHTGTRLGEAKALLVSDIVNGTASISKSMKHFEAGPQPLITTSSKRVIQLDRQTMDVLKPLLESSTEYLFGDKEPVSLSRLQRCFKKALDASGNPKITIHDLRQSHASYLIGNGANIVAVSKRLGHTDVNMTLKVYTHLLKESEEKLLEIMNS